VVQHGQGMVVHIPIEVAVNAFADFVCEEILMQIAVYLAVESSALGVIVYFPMDLAVEVFVDFVGEDVVDHALGRVVHIPMDLIGDEILV
jgi:hypothetical protein